MGNFAEYENKYEIVNGMQFSQFVGKMVSISGVVTHQSTGTKSFALRSSDNVMVQVNLRNPLDQAIEGYIEVKGISQGKSILAENFIIFNNKQFDAKNHNTLCTLLYNVPNIWKTVF